ncbi:MAG: alginate export family protein [Myxococcota bacterium]
MIGSSAFVLGASMLAAAPGEPVKEIAVGARMAVRPQARANATYGQDADDESWQVLQAARLDVAGRYGPLSVVTQLQDVRNWGQSTNPNSNDAFTGLHQGYIELAGQDLGARGRVSGYLRMGRQEVRVWSGRLIAETPWVIGRRALDALRGRLDVGRWGFEAAAAVTRTPRTLTDATGEGVQTQGDQLAWGEVMFRAHPAFEPHAGVWLRRQDATEADLERDRLVLTPGVWFHGEPVDDLVYDVEGYAQVGRDGALEHRAWGAVAVVTYTFDAKLRPGVRASYELMSGSTCTQAPEDGEGCAQTVQRDFDGAFGFRHAYRGFADQIGDSNFRDLHLRGILQPADDLSFWLDYHWLGLMESRGEWRDLTESLVGRGFDITNDRNTLGHEIDAIVNYRPFEGALEVRPGYSLLIPTAAGRTLAGSTPQHFAYVWIVANLGHRWTL